MATLIINNKLGAELERHNINGSLIDWMSSNVQAYQDMCAPPYSAMLNNKPWPYERHNQLLLDCDVIHLTIEPKETSTIYYVFTLLLAGYSYYVASNLPRGYQESTEDGQSVYSANANGNSVSLNGVIREVSGNIPIYPDVICPARRRFENNIEYLYLNLSVGAGFFDMDGSNIYIADTPFNNYANDIAFQISGPGADISNHLAYENWYQSLEVSNLEMKTTTSTPDGDWSITTTSNTITSKESGVTTTFPFSENAIFHITTGSNEGFYRVDSIAGASSETATVVKQDVSYTWENIGRTEAETEYVSTAHYNDSVTTSMTLETDESIEWEQIAGGENWYGAFEILPEHEVTSAIEVDIKHPQGLGELESGGGVSSKTVSVVIAYREVGTETWSTYTYANTAASLDEIGDTVRLDLPISYRPEIRFKRSTIESNDTNIIEDVNIVRVRCLLDSPTNYSDVTTLQIRLKGTNALAQTAENQINIKGALRILPTVEDLQDHAENAVALISSPTSSIMRFVAWQMFNAGDGTNINWLALSELDTLLESRGDELNAEFADETTLWEALKIMLAPGYCEPTIKEGLLTPVRSAATTEYNFLYTPDVMLGDGLERTDSHYNSSESLGVIVEYVDSDTGITETVQCFLTGDSEASAKRIQAIGITNKTAAWRYGMRERRRDAYKPASISFTTELDALNSDYGNADGVVSPLNANQSFFVTAENGAEITLDGDPVFEFGQYYACFRKPTGHFSGLYAITAGTNSNQIILASPAALDFIPETEYSMEPTICAIGVASELIERVWVKAISPSGTDTVSVTGEEYIAEIFADDNNEPSNT